MLAVWVFPSNDETSTARASGQPLSPSSRRSRQSRVACFPQALVPKHYVQITRSNRSVPYAVERPTTRVRLTRIGGGSVIDSGAKMEIVHKGKTSRLQRDAIAAGTALLFLVQIAIAQPALPPRAVGGAECDRTTGYD